MKSLFGGNTEFFNGKEWVKIKDYKKHDKVLTYGLDGYAKLQTPTKFIKEKIKYINKLSMGRLDMCLSDEALFIGKTRSNVENHTFTLKELYMSNMSLLTHCHLYNTFQYEDSNSLLSTSKLRVMANCIIIGNIDNSSNCTVIKNKSDANEYRYLLKTSKIKYTSKKSNDKEIFKHRLPRSIDLLLDNMLNFNRVEANVIMDEIHKISNGRKILIKDNRFIDFMQMIYTLGGKRCIVNNNNISISNKCTTRIGNVESIKNNIIEEKFQYSFIVQNEYIVVRNNGVINIMGAYRKI